MTATFPDPEMEAAARCAAVRYVRLLDSLASEPHCSESLADLLDSHEAEATEYVSNHGSLPEHRVYRPHGNLYPDIPPGRCQVVAVNRSRPS